MILEAYGEATRPAASDTFLSCRFCSSFLGVQFRILLFQQKDKRRGRRNQDCPSLRGAAAVSFLGHDLETKESAAPNHSAGGRQRYSSSGVKPLTTSTSASGTLKGQARGSVLISCCK